MKTDEEYEREWAERQRQYIEMKADFPDLITTGFSCNVGWFPILREFFLTVNDVLKDNPDREFTLLQVKEKLGGLRIYYRLLPFEADVVGNRIHAAYRAAEGRAAVTCDVCGRPGVYRSRKGFLLTRCEDHADGGIAVKREEWGR